MQLPEAALGGRGLGRLGRELGVRVDAVERQVAEDVAQVVAEPGAQLAAHPAVVTDRGTVRTRWTVVTTGAGDPLVPGAGRSVVARHGVAVATEPLTDVDWAGVGLPRAQTFADAAAGVRGERTDDGRLVLVDGNIFFGGFFLIKKFLSRLAQILQ